MAKSSVKIIVAGAAGRMGRTILSLAHRDPSVQIAGAFERADSPRVGHDVGELIGIPPISVPVHPDLRECINSGKVIVDFTQPEAVPHHLEVALEAKRAMVIGTTGLTPAALTRIRLAARKIPIVQAPNMSLGVNLLFHLVEQVADLLGENYDAEIVEEHHKHKKD